MSVTFLISDQDRAHIGESELSILATVYSDYLAPRDTEVEVNCLNLEEMQSLNLETRKLNEPTDVLSFPTFQNKEDALNHPIPGSVLLGTIALCPEKAVLYTETLPQLVHHGLLHLCGFDHETDLTAWNHEEKDILNQLTSAGLSIPGIPS